MKSRENSRSSGLNLVTRSYGRKSTRRYNRPANDTEQSQAWRGSPPYLVLNHPRRLHHRQEQPSCYSTNTPVIPIHRASYAFTGWLQLTSSHGTRSLYRTSSKSEQRIKRCHLINIRWSPVYHRLDHSRGRSRPIEAVVLRGSILETNEIYLKFS